MQTSFLPDSSDPQHPKSAPDPLNIPSLAKLLAEYDENSGRVLDRILPGQVTTPLEQRPNFDAQDNIVFPLSNELSTSPVAMVAHVAYDMVKETEKIALCSGFFIRSEPQDEGELPNRGTKPANQAPLLVSCGHTLEEMRRSDILSSANCLSATLVLVPSSTGRLVTYYASSIPSSLPLSDLALFSVSPAYKDASARLRTLPVNPYPATESTAIRIHLASFSDSASISADDHTTHENDPLVRSEWENGSILGYRDRDGREAFVRAPFIHSVSALIPFVFIQPGTYDSLAHILYRPIPTPGSSGGPIIDAETMSVIGIVTGDAMVNRVEGRRGFGTPAEALFEMFSLPGLPKQQ
ncbi:hypothetical protein DL93DRAFT_2090554 [Clavulina sp. PMI_390]|nr:hypothetical protein DL93DRAFT_2090554 [Clavulina sp. PMI_390]